MYMLAYRDHGHHDLSCDGNKNWTFSIICLLRSRFGSPFTKQSFITPSEINTKQNTHAHINMYQTCIRAKDKVEFADVQR